MTADEASLVDDAIRAELSALYGAPGRHYHGLAHISALLDLAEKYRPDIADFPAFEAAVWFHDAIYDSRAKDNEARSASLARDRLAGCAAPDRLDRIAAMIEATATHELPDFTDPALRNDAALFLDMDLSILGAPPAAFDAYEQAVRREYGWVPEQAWREGRANVLRRFLGRPHIFHTAQFRAACESRARDNIARSVARLAAS